MLRQLTPELLAGVTARAARIRESLSACPKVAAVTGLGLMIGLQTTVPAGEVVAACQERGLLVLTAKDRVRLLPALNIPTELLEEGLGILREVLS